MSPEQWSFLEQQYHRIQALPVDCWAREIAEACAGDRELERELASLLRSGASSRELLERPALEILAASQAASVRFLASFKAGDVVSHYEILAPIGHGGMGAVYKARDTRLGRIVALKFVPDLALQDAGAMRQFEREARAASALNHPNICTVHDVDGSGDRPFIVIEYLEGETLRQRLDRGALSLQELLPVALAVCDALAAAHARGIIHLDIKPANIFLTSTGLIKVLDFGAAAWLQERTPGVRSSSSGPVIGTLRYMAPEQRRGAVPAVSADVYALGIVLREALGLEGNSTRRGLSVRGVERVIARATAEDPAGRYASADELAADLRALLDLRRRRRTIAGAVLALVGSAFLMLMAQYVTRRTAQPGHALPAAPPARPTALAVLPLATTGSGDDGALLAEGITRDLIDGLSELMSVPVLSANAVFHYRGSTATAQQIGHALRASTLVLGSLRRDGDRVALELTIQDVASQRTLWAHRFDEPVQRLPALAHDVARSIAAQVDSEALRQAQSGRSEHSTTADPQAYEDYLRAAYFFHREDAASLRKAAGYYQAAIGRDPKYAAAYVGWAEALAFGAFSDRMPAAESWSRAESLLDTALGLDGRSALGHALRGMILWMHHCDAAGAQRELDLALQLDPADLTVLDYHSFFLLGQRRYDAAILEKRRVLHADPVSVSTNAELGLYLMEAGRYAEAIAQLRATLELDASFLPAIMRLAQTHLRAGQYADAVAQYRRAVALEPTPWRITELGYAYARWKKRDEALLMIARLEQLAQREHVSPAMYAEIYTALGDVPAALRWLERATPEDQVWPDDPVFEPLRSDPAFQRIAARLRSTASCPQN